MCLQCLPFFSKARNSPPSSPRPVGLSKGSHAEEKPSLKQPLLSSSPDTSYETAAAQQESNSTPQASVDSFQPPQIALPMDEAFFSPLATGSQVESGESHTESPTKSTSIKKPDTTSPEVSPLQVPVPGFSFPDALQGVLATPTPFGQGSPADDPASNGEPPLQDVPESTILEEVPESTVLEEVPESTSLETAQSAPALEVPQTHENDPHFIPSGVEDTAPLESSQSDPTLELYDPPGFSDALLPSEGPHRHRRHFRKHLQEFHQQLKAGGHVLRDEGTRHLQALMNNRNK